MAKTSKKMHIEASAGDAAPKVAPVRTPEEQKLLVTFAMALWHSESAGNPEKVGEKFVDVRDVYVPRAHRLMRMMRKFELSLNCAERVLDTPA